MTQPEVPGAQKNGYLVNEHTDTQVPGFLLLVKAGTLKTWYLVMNEFI